MDAEVDPFALEMDDRADSASPQRSSSLTLSQSSPSIPAEQDWLEAEDLDGDRWVRAEDMDNMWGDAALPASHSNRVNNLNLFPRSANPSMHASQSSPSPQPQALGLSMYPGPVSSSTPIEDQVKTSEPSPKRARLSSSPSPFKSPPCAHHTVIPVKPSSDLPDVGHSPHPSKEETLFTDDAPSGSALSSEDDTGSSGDVSASMRHLHAPIQADASSPTSEGIAASASGDDLLGSQEHPASGHGYDADEGSESSDGFEGVASHICVNCTGRIYAGDMLCLVCSHSCAPLLMLQLCMRNLNSLHNHRAGCYQQGLMQSIGNPQDWFIGLSKVTCLASSITTCDMQQACWVSVCHAMRQGCVMSVKESFAPAQECGHLPTQDDELFDHQLRSQAAPSIPQRVILAYDERMTLHAEGKWSSHPERPDRVRAVMARLAASGLTGRVCRLPLVTTSLHVLGLISLPSPHVHLCKRSRTSLTAGIGYSCLHTRSNTWRTCERGPG